MIYDLFFIILLLACFFWKIKKMKKERKKIEKIKERRENKKW